MIAAIAFTLNVSAHVAELIRTSILATDKMQVEAARTLGLSKWQAMRYITFPQSLKIAKPVYQSFIVNLIQWTSVVGYVNITDLMHIINNISSRTMQPIFMLLIGMILYVGLTYRFVLRDDIFWSDGKPVVAEDFVYSWQRLVNPATDSSYGSFISMVENAEEILAGEKDPSELGVKAVDGKTFEVKLVQRCSYFIDICAVAATYPVRKDIIEANEETWYKNHLSVFHTMIQQWKKCRSKS